MISARSLSHFATGGQSVGEVAGRMIGPRAKFLFLFVLFIGLTIVLAIFGLVIALIFSYYPESVLSVWVEIPLAVGHRSLDLPQRR